MSLVDKLQKNGKSLVLAGAVAVMPYLSGCATESSGGQNYAQQNEIDEQKATGFLGLLSGNPLVRFAGRSMINNARAREDNLRNSENSRQNNSANVNVVPADNTYIRPITPIVNNTYNTAFLEIGTDNNNNGRVDPEELLGAGNGFDLSSGQDYMIKFGARITGQAGRRVSLQINDTSNNGNVYFAFGFTTLKSNDEFVYVPVSTREILNKLTGNEVEVCFTYRKKLLLILEDGKDAGHYKVRFKK